MKKTLTLALILSLVVGIGGQAGAVNLSARALGMGGAYTGLADDLMSILYNPAGLAQSGALGLQVNAGLQVSELQELQEIAELYAELDNLNYDQNELLEMIPEELTSSTQLMAGVNLKNFGLAVNTVADTSFYHLDENTASLENDVRTEGILGLAYQLVSPPLDIGALSFGAGVKMVRHNQLNYYLDNTNQGQLTKEELMGSSFGLDLGVLARITPLINMGAQVQNVITTDYNLNGQQTMYLYDGTGWNEEEKKEVTSTGKDISPKMRIGGSIHIPIVNATIAADMDRVPLLGSNKKPVFHLGVEKNLFFNALSLRGGVYGEENSPGHYTLGVGFNLLTMHIDTALGSSEDFDSFTGALSARMKF